MRLMVESCDIGDTMVCGVGLIVVVFLVQPMSGIVDVNSVFSDLMVCDGCCGVVGESVCHECVWVFWVSVGFLCLWVV